MAWLRLLLKVQAANPIAVVLGPLSYPVRDRDQVAAGTEYIRKVVQMFYAIISSVTEVGQIVAQIT